MRTAKVSTSDLAMLRALGPQFASVAIAMEWKWGQVEPHIFTNE